jgi:hypothetical protein
MGKRRGVYRVLMEKPEERDHLGDPGVDGRIILKLSQEVVCGGVDWIKLAEDRESLRALVNVVMNLRVPCNAGNFLTSCKTVSVLRRTLLPGESE